MQPPAAALAKPPEPLALFAPNALEGDNYGTVAASFRRELFRRGLLTDDAETIVALGDPAQWDRTRGRRTFGYATPESDELPSRAITALHLIDAVLAPSAWAAEVLAIATSRPVHVVAPGVDARLFPYHRRERGAQLRFLHVSPHVDDPRKGVDLAIAAFERAFPGRNDVSLLIRSAYTFAPPVKSDPRITFARGVMARQNVSSLFDGFDALIATSRAEAFALTPLEAIASGLPAIYTGASGGADHRDLGLPVSGRPARALRPRFGSWFEPSLDELVDRLLEVDRDYDGVQERCAADARVVRERFTWSRTLAAIGDAVRAR